MNKTQKKQLTKQRRFHQQVCKKCNGLAEVDMETGGLDPGVLASMIVTPNVHVIKKLTMKELEYVINDGRPNKYRDQHPQVIKALNDELVERRLLLAKSNQI